MRWPHGPAQGPETLGTNATPRGPQRIRAVSVGLGVALVPECLVADDVARGIVTAPLRAVHVSRHGYWLCHPEDRASFEPLVKFRNWLLAQFGH